MDDPRIPAAAIDGAQWELLHDYFDRLLESDQPEAILSSIADPELRARAEMLWRDHLEAGEERFLADPVQFDVVPVFDPGQSLASRFEVERLLGRGGMGEVYLAWDRVLNERVAIKTVARLLLPSDSMRQRFLAEVQNARRVTHPNVCRIYDLFEEGTIPFFAMEYVDGKPLNELPADTSGKDKARIVHQLADGLAAAHANAIVHGDFKPGNILVASGRAVITDFGLARAYDDGRSTGLEQSAGAGTEKFMAPELLDGGKPTMRSDIFAFGRVADGLQPGARLWSRCTRANPEERPASMDEVRKSLESGRNRRYWIGGLVVTVGGGAALWRTSIPQFLFAAGARVLVNGFRADTASEPRARLARGVFVTALRQSPRFHTVADPELLPSLARIAPGASLPADGHILRALLQLHRAEYWIDARLERSASRFSMVLQILRRTDSLLVWEHAIRNIPGVVQLAELAAAALRRASGESDASLAANPAETTSYTSRVPEALESYHEAMLAVAGNRIEAAVPLLETAIRLDPAFAQAYSTLGLSYYSMRRDETGFHHVEKGWQLSSALPERERAAVESAYHSLSDDFEKTVEAARRAVSYFPAEPRYRRNLAQALCRMGSVEEGITEIRQAVAMVPDDDTIRNEMIVELCEAGRFEEALNEYRLALARGRVAKEMARAAGLANLGLGRAAEALRIFESVDRPNPRLVRGAQIMMGSFEAAIAGLQQDLAASERDRNPIQGHQVREFLCGVYFLSDRAAPAATQVREMVNLPNVPSSARFLQCTAFWAGRLESDGALAATTQALEALEARWPNGPVRAAAEYGRAHLHKRKGDLAACERLLLSSLGLSESVWGLFDAAELFAHTGRLALAEEYWKKFEVRRGNVLKHWFPGLTLHGSLLRARASAARGEFAVARSCANRILAHWAGQNPGIGIVRAARQFLPPKADAKGK